MMRELGICKISSRLYEGNPDSGAPVVNHTPLTPITFVGVDQHHAPQKSRGLNGHIFRELSFDPITKIRRGTVYRLNEHQPVDWRIHDQSRKDIEFSAWGNGVAQKIEVIGYNADSLAYLRELKKLPKVILGEPPYQSFWKLLSIEAQFDGQPLLTLKAMTSFGDVPDLLVEQIPETARAELVKRIEYVESAASRFVAIETIDACRTALSVVFGALADNLELDLGQGINKRLAANKESNPKGNGQDLVTCNGDIVRRLHSRTKPNEMKRHNTRAVSDEDANLALNCLWFILVELGWAK